MSESDNNKRYHFGEFVLSPSRRQLLRSGSEVSLIPRYFDLLLFFVRRPNEALSRQEIMETVWHDVVVSDGALTQAIRILRRALGDDARGQKFIKTVPRHGYRFILDDVRVDSDSDPLPATNPSRLVAGENIDPVGTALRTLLDTRDDNEGRAAAEALHTHSTTEALMRIAGQSGEARARARLRDARWSVADAGPVPLWGEPGFLATVGHLVRARGRDAVRLASKRWLAAALGGVVGGVVAGVVGGLLLRFGPGSTASNSLFLALPVIGAVIGGLAASGVGAGLAAAEAMVRSYRTVALVLLGALGGGVIGALAHSIGKLTLASIFGSDFSPVAGGLEGVVIGGAAGLGYGISTGPPEGGMATPHGSSRVMAATTTGIACALAAMGLAVVGRYLGAMSLDWVAQSFPASQVQLAPLARLFGETEPGVRTAVLISAFEGFVFGSSLVMGLTHRAK